MTIARRWTLVATIVASSMTFIDGTVVNVALPALQTALDATITDVQWVVEAYALFLGALILVGGSLGDQLGRRRVFLAGVVSFCAASIICGVAPTPLVLIVGRALQGIGAAFLVPGSLAIISATYTGPERGRAIGTWSGFSAITTAIGPVVGGWLIEHVGWRAVFFINVPLGAAVVILSLRYVQETKDPSRDGAIDWAGAALAIIGLSGVVFGLLEWPPLGAGHPFVLASLTVGAIAVASMVAVEARARNPMVPRGVFASRAFTLANLLTLCLYAALGELLFILPLELIQVRGYPPTLAGAALLPFPIIMFALSRWSGGLVATIGRRVPLTAGPSVVALGFLIFAFAPRSASFTIGVLPAVVVLGLGMAITVAPLTTTVMDSVASAHTGVASGVNNAVARVAGLIAIAVFGVIVSRTFAGDVNRRLALVPLPSAGRTAIARELPRMAGADVRSISSLTGEQRVQVRAAIQASAGNAFRVAMLGAALLALLAAGTGAFIHDPPAADAVG